MTRLSALLAACLALACGGGEPPVDGGPLAPTVELGTGVARFEALPTDAETPLELVAGPQGGFHLDVSVRLRDLDPQQLTLTYAALEDGVPRESPSPTVYLVTRSRVIADGAGGFFKIGDRLILDIGDPSEAVGASLRLTVEAEDRDGLRATDERSVRVVDER